MKEIILEFIKHNKDLLNRVTLMEVLGMNLKQLHEILGGEYSEGFETFLNFRIGNFIISIQEYTLRSVKKTILRVYNSDKKMVKKIIYE